MHSEGRLENYNNTVFDSFTSLEQQESSFQMGTINTQYRPGTGPLIWFHKRMIFQWTAVHFQEQNGINKICFNFYLFVDGANNFLVNMSVVRQAWGLLRLLWVSTQFMDSLSWRCASMIKTLHLRPSETLNAAEIPLYVCTNLTLC